MLRLAALRHFAQAGWPINDIGTHISTLDIDQAGWVLLGSTSGLVQVQDLDQLENLVAQPERFTVYDLRPLRHRIGSNTDQPDRIDTSTVAAVRRRA